MCLPICDHPRGHDALATIEGGFDAYAGHLRPHAHASPEMAAATAAWFRPTTS